MCKFGLEKKLKFLLLQSLLANCEFTIKVLETSRSPKIFKIDDKAPALFEKKFESLIKAKLVMKTGLLAK